MARFRMDGLPVVSFKTIYRWIYKDRLKLAVDSALESLLRSVPEKFVLEKHLDTGS
ncbi:IS30 family transposase [Paenibacillus amylolyticus]|uniref:IS30 family transposase n=1 Tax=Paenibacillus amylolyticus TaxID=1451 RepID=A0AAP5LR00_PAEAM|nr:IS30 family transposase [Paenibacillus amylolyticus]